MVASYSLTVLLKGYAEWLAENAVDQMIFKGNHTIMTAHGLTTTLDETEQAGPATKKPRHEGGGAVGGEF